MADPNRMCGTFFTRVASVLPSELFGRATGSPLPRFTHKKSPLFRGLKNPGNDLLSHTVSHAVSSALEGLTTVFGMGTGVSPPLKSPEIGKQEQTH